MDPHSKLAIKEHVGPRIQRWHVHFVPTVYILRGETLQDASFLAHPSF
ncbi:MAG: hypothetical protein AAF564_06055 [Bacteroidota bacterium]